MICSRVVFLTTQRIPSRHHLKKSRSSAKKKNNQKSRITNLQHPSASRNRGFSLQRTIKKKIKKPRTHPEPGWVCSPCINALIGCLCLPPSSFVSTSPWRHDPTLHEPHMLPTPPQHTEHLESPQASGLPQPRLPFCHHRRHRCHSLVLNSTHSLCRLTPLHQHIFNPLCGNPRHLNLGAGRQH